MKQTAQSLIAQAGRINLKELYGLLLIGIGIPTVFYVYFDWRAALAVAVVAHTALVLLSLRSNPKAVS